jgi:hypothetical protein
MPLPGPRGYEEAHASGPQAPDSLLPDNTLLEFRVILSACRTFMGTASKERIIDAAQNFEPARKQKDVFGDGNASRKIVQWILFREPI